MTGPEIQRTRSVLRVLGPAALLLASLPLDSRATGSAEYLASDNPIPTDLRDTPSATDSLDAGSALKLFEAVPPLGTLLRGMREHLPPTGHALFDDAVFHVDPRTYYRRRDNGNGTTSEAFALGGSVGLVSGMIGDVARVVVTGFTSQKLYGPRDRDGSGLLRPRQQSYTVLGEAYAKIKLGKSLLSVGRQSLDLPYINANDGRMTPNTFEAIGFLSTPTEDFHFGAAHVTRIKFRNSSDFESLSRKAGAAHSSEGVTLAGFRWILSENFHLSAIDEYGWDTFNTFYIETERLFPLRDGLSLKTGAQFTDQRSVGGELLGSFDAQHAGARASLGYGGFITSASFTWTSVNGVIMKPWGGTPAFNSVMISDFDRPGEKSVRGTISYDLSRIGLTGLAASATLVYGDTPDSGSAASPDQREVDLDLDYHPPAPGFESLSLRLRYGTNEQDGGLEREDFRAILNYSIPF